MKSRMRYLLDSGYHDNRIEAAGEKNGPDRQRVGSRDEEAEIIGRCHIREDAARYYGAAERLPQEMLKNESASPPRAVPLFWSFPKGRGAKQPWRRRLWEHRRDEL